MDACVTIPAHYYQQFDADYSLDVPAEGYGGWRREPLAISIDHTAFVSMHAWDTGTPDEFAGWWRAVEYMPRAAAICRDVYPGLLAAIRASGMPLFHVAGGGDYVERYAGYRRAAALASPEPPAPEQIEPDEALRRLQAFRGKHVFVGEHNAEDVKRGFARVDFPPEARPLPEEGVAATGNQLFALCKERKVNHLIYMGFAVNWCLLLSPGGMHDMAQRGIMCSVIRDATTAVENRESARHETAKELGLWRVALAFGFVFDAQDVIASLASLEGAASLPEEAQRLRGEEPHQDAAGR